MTKLPKLVGVIHLPPLAGAPKSIDLHPAEALQTAGILAVREAQSLVKVGFDGIILENFGDVPFYKNQVPPETIACLSVIAAAVREAIQVPIGINVLRNDGRAALAIAAVTGCDFIRINVLSGLSATDQGLVEGEASFLIRERNRLGADISIFADIHVKHAVSISSKNFGLAIEEMKNRALADAIIITGETTGRMAEISQIQMAGEVSQKNKIPLYIGSGVTHVKIKEIKPWVDGFIVGSALRKEGQAGAPLELKKAREFVKEYSKSSRKRKKGRSLKLYDEKQTQLPFRSGTAEKL